MVYRVIRHTKKYKNIPTHYRGSSYDSKAEAQYAMWLDSEKKAGRIKRWEKQKKIELTVKGHHICNYYIDFVIHHTDGLKEYVEIKGMVLPVWRIKWKLFEALYSSKKNVKLTIVKV